MSTFSVAYCVNFSGITALYIFFSNSFLFYSLSRPSIAQSRNSETCTKIILIKKIKIVSDSHYITHREADGVKLLVFGFFFFFYTVRTKELKADECDLNWSRPRKSNGPHGSRRVTNRCDIILLRNTRPRWRPCRDGVTREGASGRRWKIEKNRDIPNHDVVYYRFYHFDDTLALTRACMCTFAYRIRTPSFYIRENIEWQISIVCISEFAPRRSNSGVVYTYNVRICTGLQGFNHPRASMYTGTRVKATLSTRATGFTSPVDIFPFFPLPLSLSHSHPLSLYIYINLSILLHLFIHYHCTTEPWAITPPKTNPVTAWTQFFLRAHSYANACVCMWPLSSFYTHTQDYTSV
jgi:hypothetical protein